MSEQEIPKDWFEFMQKAWNPMSFPLPSMMTPTVDAEEIKKKIADLKAVETWLTMNTGMVQMTVNSPPSTACKQPANQARRARLPPRIPTANSFFFASLRRRRAPSLTNCNTCERRHLEQTASEATATVMARPPPPDLIYRYGCAICPGRRFRFP